MNGLGPKLCDRLAEKLQVYCSENGLPMPEPPNTVSATRGELSVASTPERSLLIQKLGEKKRTSDQGAPDNEPVKKPRKTKQYVPTLRSGPYALLLGLSTLDENASHGMTKAQLIEVAQPYCDSSFTAPPDPTKFHTAWNSMKTLVQKDLVYEHGRPLRKYILTEEGWEVTKKIKGTLPGASSSQSTLSFGTSLVCKSERTYNS